MSSTLDSFEAVSEESKPLMTFTLDLAGIGVSLINRRLMEVIYATLDQLKFEYVDSSVAQAVTLSCGSLQVDNQLHDALFPVILQPTPLPKGAAEVGALPTIQASIIWLKDQGAKLNLTTNLDHSLSAHSPWCSLCQVLFYPSPSPDSGGR